LSIWLLQVAVLEEHPLTVVVVVLVVVVVVLEEC
jgi:hypothetical protein